MTGPKSIKVVPATTHLDWKYEDGLLRLALRNFQTHAAIVLDGTAPAAINLLPPTAPRAIPRTYDRLPLILAEDFESTPVGKFPAHPIWSANVDAKTAIRVAMDPTSAGNRVLEFVDAPDARAAFLPYLIIQPKVWTGGRPVLPATCIWSQGPRWASSFGTTGPVVW